jgi:hypothetical protein
MIADNQRIHASLQIMDVKSSRNFCCGKGGQSGNENSGFEKFKASRLMAVGASFNRGAVVQPDAIVIGGFFPKSIL